MDNALSSRIITLRYLLHGLLFALIIFIFVASNLAAAQPPAGYGANRMADHSCDPGDPQWTTVITWGHGGDFDPSRGETLDDARKALPKTGNVLLGILGGEYTNVDLPWVGGGRDQVTICGLSTVRPVLHANNDQIAFQDIEHGTVRHLEIANGGVVMSNPRWAGFTLQGVFIYGRQENCVKSGTVDEQWLAARGLTQATATLIDVELTRCGSYNTRHNLYLSTRRLAINAVRVSSYGAHESQAFKSIAEKIAISDSYFGTVTDWSTPALGPWSSSLVDIASCAEITIANTYFKATEDWHYRGTQQALFLRARRQILGCDQPLYDSPQFNDPLFWAEVTEHPLTDPYNPATFKTYIAENVFEFVDFDGRRPNAGVRDDGTYPRQALYQFSNCSEFLSVPVEWVERSVIFSANNDWLGYQPHERYKVAVQDCASETSDPLARLPTPARHHVSLGGEDGAPITLPDWFQLPDNGSISEPVPPPVTPPPPSPPPPLPPTENQPPQADAGGPYILQAGTSLQLDGSASSDPDGDPLTYGWDFNDDGEIDASGSTPLFQAPTTNTTATIGIHLWVTDPDGATASDTALVTIEGDGGTPPGDSDVHLLFSTQAASPVPGVAAPYDDADIYRASDNGIARALSAIHDLGLPARAKIDGLHYREDSDLCISLQNKIALGGLGVIEDEDIICYQAGAWQSYFDGSDHGLDASKRQDIDAFALHNGMLYFSTRGRGIISGVAGPYDDADVYRWDGNSFARIFDASAHGLLRHADIDGLAVANAQTLYFSLARNDIYQGGTLVPGLDAVSDESVVSFNNGLWQLYFDGNAAGLNDSNGQDIDALSILP